MIFSYPAGRLPKRLNNIPKTLAVPWNITDFLLDTENYEQNEGKLHHFLTILLNYHEGLLRSPKHHKNKIPVILLS